MAKKVSTLYRNDDVTIRVKILILMFFNVNVNFNVLINHSKKRGSGRDILYKFFAIMSSSIKNIYVWPWLIHTNYTVSTLSEYIPDIYFRITLLTFM